MIEDGAILINLPDAHLKPLGAGLMNNYSASSSASSVCCRLDCKNIGKKLCAACRRTIYCSSSCQKQHWKSQHKNRCLAILPDHYLSVVDVLDILRDQSEQLRRLSESGGSNSEQILSLQHTLTFAEYQLSIPSTPGRFYYCQRKDGVMIDNMTVAHSVTSLYYNLGTRYSNEQSMQSAKLAETYFKKSRSFLEILWLILDAEVEEDAPFDVTLHKDLILEQLSQTERKLAINCMELKRLSESDVHCQQSLTFANLVTEGSDKKMTLLFEALLCYGELRGHQYWTDCDRSSKGAYDYFEEAYILVSEAYGPVHPQVQEVSVHLIGSLIKLGDFIEAERFARINYESLISLDSGVDPDSRQVMKGASMLVKICYVTAQQRKAALVDLDEAEQLARNAVRIAMQTDGSHGYDTGIYQFDLYQVLRERLKAYRDKMTVKEIAKATLEMRLLLDRSHDITVRCHGLESKYAMYMTQEMHFFYKALHGALSEGRDKDEALKRLNELQHATVGVSMRVNGITHAYTLALLNQMKLSDIARTTSSVYPKEVGFAAVLAVTICCALIRQTYLILLQYSSYSNPV
jgi:MYND finger